jgi:hypothetical protein
MTTAFAFAADRRLSKLDCRVAGQLILLAKSREYVCHAARTIGGIIGSSGRRVQIALANLARCGYIRLERDYGLTTRRRIWLLWRARTPNSLGSSQESPAPNSLGAGNGAQSAPESAPSSVPPLDSPIRSLETEHDDGRRDAIPESSSSFEPPRKSPEDPEGAPEPERQPQPEPEPEPLDVAPLVARAEAIFEPGEPLKDHVAELAREYSPAEVAEALDITARKTTRPGPNPVFDLFGFLRGVLKNRRRERGTRPVPRRTAERCQPEASPTLPNDIERWQRYVETLPPGNPYRTAAQTNLIAHARRGEPRARAALAVVSGHIPAAVLAELRIIPGAEPGG